MWGLSMLSVRGMAFRTVAVAPATIEATIVPDARPETVERPAPPPPQLQPPARAVRALARGDDRAQAAPRYPHRRPPSRPCARRNPCPRPPGPRPAAARARQNGAANRPRRKPETGLSPRLAAARRARDRHPRGDGRAGRPREPCADCGIERASRGSTRPPLPVSRRIIASRPARSTARPRRCPTLSNSPGSSDSPPGWIDHAHVIHRLGGARCAGGADRDRRHGGFGQAPAATTDSSITPTGSPRCGTPATRSRAARSSSC